MRGLQEDQRQASGEGDRAAGAGSEGDPRWHRSVNNPQVQRVGAAYLYRWPSPEPVEIEVDEIRQRSGDWISTITVRYRSEGVRPHLFEGTHNLSAAQSRTALARFLTEKVPIKWGDYLEFACVQ